MKPDARKLALLHKLTRELRDKKMPFETALAFVAEEGANIRSLVNILLDIYDQTFPMAKANGKDVEEKATK